MRQNRVHLMPPMSNFYARICVKATPSSNINIDREAVLFRLGLYRRNYAMVKTVSHGFYQLTEKGRRYLEERYPEAGASTTHHQTGETVSMKTPLPDLFPLGKASVP